MQYVIILILYDVFVTLTQLYGSLSTRMSCYRMPSRQWRIYGWGGMVVPPLVFGHKTAQKAPKMRQNAPKQYNKKLERIRIKIPKSIKINVHRVSKKLCKFVYVRTSSNFHQF